MGRNSPRKESLFQDTDLAFVLQWEEASLEQVHAVLLHTAYPAALRLAEGVLGNVAKAETAALWGLSNAARARAEFAGQTTALDWVLGYVEKEILAAGRRWGLKRRAVRRLTAEAAENSVPTSPLAPAELAALHVALAELDSASHLPPAGRFGELAWILGLATLVLIGLLRFSRTGAGETPPPLFLTAGPSTPTVIPLDGAFAEILDEVPADQPEYLTFLSSDNIVFELRPASAPFSEIESRSNPPYIRQSVNAIALSPDGRLAATRVNDEVVIWTLPEGDYAYSFRIDSFLLPIAFADRSNLLATGSASAGSVAVWSIDSSFSRRVFTLEEQEGSLVDLDFSPDDRYLLIATTAGIWIWELSGSGQAILVREIRNRSMITLDVSPDGTVFASVGLRGTIEIRSLPGGEVLHQLEGDNNISEISFSTDGERLAVGMYGQHVLVWTLSPSGSIRNEAAYWSVFGGTQSLAYSPNGRFLAVSTGMGIVVWDLDASDPARATVVYENNLTGTLAFSTDGNLLAMAGRDGKLYQILAGRDEQALASGTTTAPSSDEEFVFFQPSPYDAYPSQQVLLIEDGQPVDPTTPLEIFYSISTREFSSQTGVYTPIPENIPDEAVFLGQRNSGFRIVSVLYELPLHPYQQAILTIHLATGVTGPALNPEDFPDRRTGASAEISMISLGKARIPGELAIGGWVFIEADAVGIPTDKAWVVVEGQMRWLATPDRMILRWEQGGMLFELAVAPIEGEIPEGVDVLTANELIAVAGELIDQLID